MTNSSSFDGENNFDGGCCCGSHKGSCDGEDSKVRQGQSCCDNENAYTDKSEDTSEDKPIQDSQDNSSSGENEWHDQFIRLYAEFDNYKKRTSREREFVSVDASLAVLREILPLFDNLERASSIAAEGEEALKFKEGIDAICKQFTSIFQKLGVSKIEALGQQFNPELHNAVLHVEDENYPANHIVEEMLAGYMYKDKVLRHSMVRVAN